MDASSSRQSRQSSVSSTAPMAKSSPQVTTPIESNMPPSSSISGNFLNGSNDLRRCYGVKVLIHAPWKTGPTSRFRRPVKAEVRITDDEGVYFVDLATGKRSHGEFKISHFMCSKYQFTILPQQEFVAPKRPSPTAARQAEELEAECAMIRRRLRNRKK